MPGLLRRSSSAECAAAAGVLAALGLYFRRRRRDITLTYLDAKGSAEATRLALTIGRVPFRDERLSYAEVALLRDELPKVRRRWIIVVTDVLTLVVVLLPFWFLGQ